MSIGKTNAVSASVTSELNLNYSTWTAPALENISAGDVVSLQQDELNLNYVNNINQKLIDRGRKYYIKDNTNYSVYDTVTNELLYTRPISLGEFVSSSFEDNAYMFSSLDYYVSSETVGSTTTYKLYYYNDNNSQFIYSSSTQIYVVGESLNFMLLQFYRTSTSGGPSLFKLNKKTRSVTLIESSYESVSYDSRFGMILSIDYANDYIYFKYNKYEKYDDYRYEVFSYLAGYDLQQGISTKVYSHGDCYSLNIETDKNTFYYYRKYSSSTSSYRCYLSKYDLNSNKTNTVEVSYASSSTRDIKYLKFINVNSAKNILVVGGCRYDDTSYYVYMRVDFTAGTSTSISLSNARIIDNGLNQNSIVKCFNNTVSFLGNYSINYTRGFKKIDSSKNIKIGIAKKDVIKGIETEAYNIFNDIDTPIIRLSTNIVSWYSVEGATSYVIYSNDIVLTEVTTTSVDLSTLITTSGTYTIKIKAKAESYAESDYSNSVSYTVS